MLICYGLREAIGAEKLLCGLREAIQDEILQWQREAIWAEILAEILPLAERSHIGRDIAMG